MKRFFLFITMLFAATAFTACNESNEGNGNTTTSYAPDIAGTYNGYSYSESVMQAYPWTAGTEALSIVANADDTATLTFTSSGMWGSYEVESLTITQSGSTYSVSGTGKVSLGMGGGDPGSYDFTMTGTVNSATDARFVFVATVGAMGNVTTTFSTGSMPDGLKIVGKYEGYTDASSMMFPSMITEGAVTTITYNESGTVNITFVGVDWGTYELEDITVGSSNGTYTVAGDGVATIERNDTSNEYAFTMEGSIVSLTEAALVYTVTMGGMGEVVIEFIPGAAPVEE